MARRVWYDREVASLPLGLGTAYERKLKRRFVASVGPTALVAAIATPVDPTTLENRVAENLSPGVGGKVLLRAGRALVGRFVSRVGGGIVAGIAGWLVADFALGKLDELQGRKGLEQELTELVDAEKEKVKSALSGAVDDVQFGSSRVT